jgi:hypothetical protein
VVVKNTTTKLGRQNIFGAEREISKYNFVAEFYDLKKFLEDSVILIKED